MVMSCAAVGCTYRYKKGDNIGLFRFPKDTDRRCLWIKAVKRANWQPTSYSRICGKHFQTGKPNDDINHPDYVPTLFSFPSSKRSASLYEKRKAHQEKKQERKCRNEYLKKKEVDAAESLLLLSDEVLSRTNDNLSEDLVVERGTQQSNELQELHNKIKQLENENQKQKEMIVKMDKEIRTRREEKAILHEAILNHDITKRILNNEKNLALHTGLHSIDIFNFLLEVTENHAGVECLSRETQLLIVLIKIKLNPLNSKIAFDFDVSIKTVRHIFEIWIPLLAKKLKDLIIWPSKIMLRKNCPESFKNSDFKSTVCIIDCTEVPIQSPGNQIAKSQMWSNYKNHYTIKFLVGITPSGQISFVSDAFSGRTSDKEITLQSGFLEYLSPGDLVIADRGFNMEEHFEAIGAKLFVPSRTAGKKQLSKHEVYYSKKLSNVRIHVERVIRLLKKFRILQNTIPINFLDYMDDIIVICAGLSNISEGIVS